LLVKSVTAFVTLLASRFLDWGPTSATVHTITVEHAGFEAIMSDRPDTLHEVVGALKEFGDALLHQVGHGVHVVGDWQAHEIFAVWETGLQMTKAIECAIKGDAEGVAEHAVGMSNAAFSFLTDGQWGQLQGTVAVAIAAAHAQGSGPPQTLEQAEQQLLAKLGEQVADMIFELRHPDAEEGAGAGVAPNHHVDHPPAIPHGPTAAVHPANGEGMVFTPMIIERSHASDHVAPASHDSHLSHHIHSGQGVTSSESVQPVGSHGMTFTPMIIERGQSAHGGHQSEHHGQIGPSTNHTPESVNVHLGHDHFGGPAFVDIADLIQGPVGVVPDVGPFHCDDVVPILPQSTILE
jgi:hypothetical protein